MGRGRTPDREVKRDKVINVRVTEDERKIAESKAESAGMSLCDFVRHLIEVWKK